MPDNLRSVITELGNNDFCVLGVVMSVMTDFQDLSDMTWLQLWVTFPKMP